MDYKELDLAEQRIARQMREGLERLIDVMIWSRDPVSHRLAAQTLLSTAELWSEMAARAIQIIDEQETLRKDISTAMES